MTMMTRVLLTFLVGLVVSLGALVSVGSGVAWAGNWNLSDTEKAKRNAKTASEKVKFVSDKHLCTWAELDLRLDEYGYAIDDAIRAQEIERRSLSCFSEVANNKLCSSLINNNFFGSRKKRYSAEIKRRGLNCGVGDNKKSAAIGSASIQSGIPDASKIPLLTDDKICGWLHAATRSGATAGAGASGRYEEPLPLDKNNLRVISALIDEGMRRSLSCCLRSSDTQNKRKNILGTIDNYKLNVTDYCQNAWVELWCC